MNIVPSTSDQPWRAEKWLPYLLVLLLAIPDAALSFDGKRKGFVVGLGLGVAPVAHWSVRPSGPDIDENGFAANALLGYAWDDRNAIVYEGNGCAYKSSELSDAWVVQGLDAIRWYHYWGSGQRHPFTSIGIGLWFFESQYGNIDGRGFGYSAGVGYEIFKQVQVGLYYNGGRTSNHFSVKANHNVVTLLVTVVAY